MDEKSTPMISENERTDQKPGTPNRKQSSNRKQLFTWKMIAGIFILVAIGLFIGLIVVLAQTRERLREADKKLKLQGVTLENNPECDKPLTGSQSKLASRSNQLFSGLTEEETQDVIQFLMKDPDLKIVPVRDADIYSNYIYTIEHHIPNKTDVTAYLDRSTDRVPVKQARAILFLGETREVKEYIIRPIPKPTEKIEINVKRLSWKNRPICYEVEEDIMINAVSTSLQPIKYIIKDSFTRGCNDSSVLGCLFFNVAVRSVMNSDDRHVITWFFATDDRIEDYYMYPVPLYIILKTPTTGKRYRFDVAMVYYKDKHYRSIEELKADYDSDPSIRYTLPDLTKNIGKYGSPRYVKQGDTIDEKRRPPVPVHPDGARFAVTGQHVEWLDWSFNIHARTVAGIQLFDVRYARERIAYELSMQDILVIYSGKAPDDFFKHYFDNGWATGRYNMPLIRDVDCPPGASYMDSNIYAVSNDKSIKMKDAICIFEHRNSIPLRRHFSEDFTTWGYRFAFSMPDTVLVVRQILTIWNYDYIFDYEFHQNGVIELKVSSTGYVAVTSNLESGETLYGYVINSDWNAGANLHHHLFNYKLDIDVAGENNRFKTLDLESQYITTPYAPSAWSQMIMKETFVGRERNAAVRYDFNKPKYYVIYNFYESTTGGKSNSLAKGYKISSNGFSKVVLPENNPIVSGGGSWTKYQLAVTKFKETERGTASHFVQGDPFQPAVNFDDFINDNETLLDTDLVVWVTVGLHHIPSYEDLPVTTTPGKTVGVTLAPFNYFERDPSIHSRDAAIFWNRNAFTFKDSYFNLSSNATCPAPSTSPMINA